MFHCLGCSTITIYCTLFWLAYFYAAKFALQHSTPVLSLFRVFHSSQLAWYPLGKCSFDSIQKSTLVFCCFQAFTLVVPALPMRGVVRSRKLCRDFRRRVAGSWSCSACHISGSCFRFSIWEALFLRIFGGAIPARQSVA